MDERIISAVSDYPELYNSTLQSYRDLTIKAKAWRAVSLQSGLSEDECRRKWKGLRDTFIRLQRRIAAGDKPRPWRHFRSLAFITPYMRSVPSQSASYYLEEDQDEDHEEEEEEEEKPTRQEERKHRREEKRVRIGEEEDEEGEEEEVEEEERNGESATTTDDNSAFIIHEVEGDQDYHPSPSPFSAAPSPHSVPVSNGPSRKRRWQVDGGTMEDMEDEMFFFSLLPYLRRLPYKKKSAVKLKIHQLLYDAEFK